MYMVYIYMVYGIQTRLLPWYWLYIMNKLSESIYIYNAHFRPEDFNVEQIDMSCSDESGEGEHRFLLSLLFFYHWLNFWLVLAPIWYSTSKSFKIAVANNRKLFEAMPHTQRFHALRIYLYPLSMLLLKCKIEQPKYTLHPPRYPDTVSSSGELNDDSSLSLVACHLLNAFSWCSSRYRCTPEGVSSFSSLALET